MNQIIYKKNYILFNLNNGDKKAFLSGTIRHHVNGSSLSFYLSDNEIGELPVINVNYNQTVVNGIQITDENIDTIFEDLYNYDIFEIIDFSLLGDVLTLITSDGEYKVDLTKYNYDTIITELNNSINTVDDKLNIEITRSIEKDIYLESKINSEIFRSINNDNELLNNINSVNDKLNNEITRSTNKDTEIETNFSNEVTRAKEAESILTTSLVALHTSISNEVIRSTNKDTEIETNLSHEVTRAKEAESVLNTKFDNYYSKTETDNKFDNLDLKEYYKKTEVDAKLTSKVDKEAGKELSSNDYTLVDKTKLAGLFNYNDSGITKAISDEATRAANAESVLEGKKANKADVYDKAEVDTKLTSKVDKEAGKELSSNDYTLVDKTKLVGLFNYNDSGITKAISDEVTRATNAESVLEGKKANKIDVYAKGESDNLLLSKSDKSNTYTKTETDNKITSLISGIASDLTNVYKKAEVDTKLTSKVDKEAGKGLSSNDYSAVEKTKLAGLSNYNDSVVRGLIDVKQDKLISGTNIKTINGNSLLGSGNIVIEGGVSDAYTKVEVDNKLDIKSDKSNTYTKTETDNKITSLISGITSDLTNVYVKSEVDTKLSTKVDKVSGKGLSSNDYTLVEKTKLTNTPNIVTKTQVEYDSLTTKDNNTLYIIIG